MENKKIKKDKTNKKDQQKNQATNKKSQRYQALKILK